MYLLFACIVIQGGATKQNCAVTAAQKAAVGSSLLMKRQRVSKILLDTKLHDHIVSEDNDGEEAAITKNNLRVNREDCVFELFEDTNCAGTAARFSMPQSEIPPRWQESEKTVRGVKINDKKCKITASSGLRTSACGDTSNSCQTFEPDSSVFLLYNNGECSQTTNDQSPKTDECVFEFFTDDNCETAVIYEPSTVSNATFENKHDKKITGYYKQGPPDWSPPPLVKKVRINHAWCKLTMGHVPDESTVCGGEPKKPDCTSCQNVHISSPAYQFTMSNAGCPKQQSKTDDCVFQLFKDDKCTKPLDMTVSPENVVTTNATISSTTGWGSLHPTPTEKAGSVIINNEWCKLIIRRDQQPDESICGGQSECQSCQTLNTPADENLEMSHGDCST